MSYRMSYRNDELKIRHEHLTKKAIIYVRQSTKSQDLRNTGSKARQYDLFKLALELGWKHENVIVVDQDRAKSASSLNGREAFKGGTHRSRARPNRGNLLPYG